MNFTQNHSKGAVFMSNQGKLGILGGMGPLATQVCYQRIVNKTKASCDQEHLPTVILCDTGMPDRTSAILSGDEQPVLDRMMADAQSLATMGCTAMAIACNTAHHFAHQLELPIPLVDMIQEAVSAMKAKGYTRIGVMATDGTIQAGIYQKECERQGLEMIAPSADAQKLVMSLIYDDIKSGGTGNPETFAKIDADFRAKQCDGVILACTELSVYIEYHEVPDYYVDAMDALSVACIKACGYSLRD